MAAYPGESEIRRLTARMRGLAVRYTRNWADAEDVVQDALLAAWKHRDQAREFGPWLRRIVGHRALILLRARDRNQSISLDSEAPGLRERIEAALAVVSGIEAALMVASELAHMPRVLRVPIEEVALRERDVRNVALELGVTASAIKNRLYHGRRMLKHRLSFSFPVDKHMKRRILSKQH